MFFVLLSSCLICQAMSMLIMDDVVSLHFKLSTSCSSSSSFHILCPSPPGLSSFPSPAPLLLPARIPQPNLTPPILIHPPRAGVRQYAAIIPYIVLPVRRHTLTRSPTAHCVVARSEGTWAARRWGHPEVHLAVLRGAERDQEAGFLPVAGRLSVLCRRNMEKGSAEAKVGVANKFWQT